MIKPTLETLASGAIIYQASQPQNIFCEMKSDDYYVKAFRRHLCPFGGNWGREGDALDRSPRDTVLREIKEELVLENWVGEDVFKEVCGAVERALTPWGDFFLTVPAAVFQCGDPETALRGRTSISSMWTAGIPDIEWMTLRVLLSAFGNFCNEEGISTLTSLDEVLSRAIPFSWGFDHVIKEFWLAKGLSKAASIPPSFPGILIERIRDAPMDSYDMYLDRYEVLQPR